ncbi:MAG: CBS domain-containing protein [Cyclobacteriaceae bacterium]
MVAEKIINSSIFPLKTSDTLDKALEWMEEMKVSHLPVIDNFVFKGMISEAVLLEQSDLSASLSDVKLDHHKTFANQSEPVFDVIRTVNEHQLSVISVVDDQENYLGSITIKDLLDWVCKGSAYQHPGGVVVLNMQTNDYSLSQISQLVESDGVKILNASVQTIQDDHSKIRVVLKLNKDNISRVVASFERHKYTIEAIFSDSEASRMGKDRVDNLLKYLDI